MIPLIMSYKSDYEISPTQLLTNTYNKYSKRYNKFLFPAFAGTIYGSSCKAENEIPNVVNYKNDFIL